MKRLVKSTKRRIKGAPTSVLLSIAIHAGILLLASGLVVFNVVKKMERKFIPPPPIDRPKMDLKKPRVKVKKAEKPRATQRITKSSWPISRGLHIPLLK